MDQLDKTFATPIDREDIVRSTVSFDEIIGYAKTTVREIELLRVEPDDAMQEMAAFILEGGRELQTGYQKLRKHRLEAEPNAPRAHKTERSVEKVYRRAVSQLLEDQRILESVTTSDQPEIAAALREVVQVLRRREFYQHLSNAADRIETAAEVLHNIVVKIA